MGECGDCRWWKNGEQDKLSVGVCPLLSTVKGDIAEILLYGPGDHPGDHPGEKVMTHQEFGCIQFEARA